MKAIQSFKEAIALNFLIKVVKLFYCVILVKVYIVNNMYSCTNQGCRQSFKWRQQLVRHTVKCEKAVIEKELKFKKVDDCCKCVKCGVTYKYKTGLN